jgi:FtsP/CotA-like multicopper oxidase with cupredoxin domain
MAVTLSRRHLLQGTAAAAAGGLTPGLVRSAWAQTPTQLNAMTRTLEVKGKSATVFGIQQSNGVSGLYLDPGQRFMVDLANRLTEDTIIHWHGQTPPVAQDGVAITGEEKVIAAGTVQPYDYAPRPGTYWMHSHQGLQEMQLMTAPLIVRSADDLKRDAQEVTVILNDFTFKTPEEVMKEVTGGAMAATGGPDSGGKADSGGTADSGGKADSGDKAGGSTAGAPSAGGAMPGMSSGTQQSAMPGGAAMSAGAMPSGAMPAMAGGAMPATSAGAMPGVAGGAMPGMGGNGTPPAAQAMRMGGNGQPDVNDFDYDAYLANDRTLDDPMVVRTERNGRVRLRLINGSSSTIYWIELNGAEGTLIGVDGEQVHPLRGRRFPMAEAQRLDIMVDVPAGKVVSVLAQREGDRVRTGIILAAPGARVVKIPELAMMASEPMGISLEARLSALKPLAPRAVDRRLAVVLSGSMAPYSWAINGRNWANHEPLRIAKGQRVEFDIVNTTPMGHPMHLHGHAFQVVALNGKALSGALRDTVQVPPKGSVKIAFDADNPGRWVFHCHNLLHMETGMITEVVYDT